MQKKGEKNHQLKDAKKFQFDFKKIFKTFSENFSELFIIYFSKLANV